MGFVGDGSNIAIVPALPLSSFLIVVSIYSQEMGTLHLKFSSCLRLRSPDVYTNSDPRRPVPASCRILFRNVWGLSGNLGDLAVALSWYDILLCSQTLVSDLRHVPELLVPGFGHPVFLCRGKLPHAHGMAAYVREGNGAFCQPKLECGCCEMLVVRICGLRQNFYV